ncbi:hypothetical protein LMH87_001596 [Akanthomyces muscarius]|uniref:Ankyrin repeat protein n=1 Tax=Akanthomyces muscarius TaxID=2231603 RepID=A0A9W8Q546_AKAMU|nr:hypothetical protein LMH87_001596 [Akanthomyces muscarius]KAJ4147043.1 hypothetical protein LMH87_001596 [Akanthomyces muscarius]
MAVERIEYAAASLPALVDDVFFMVLDYLEPAHLAPLVRCCQLLHTRALPVLLGTEVRRDRALLWACRHGRLSAVRRAVAFGANIVAPAYLATSRVTQNGAGATQIVYRTSPLRVAAQSGNLVMLQVLMELGATLDMPREFPQKMLSPDREISSFLASISEKPERLPLLLLFFNSALAGCGGGFFQGASYAQICLQHAFGGPKLPPVEAVRFLVSYKGPGGCASVRRLQASKTKKACPLARAILGRQRELEELLVAHRADIHGIPYWTEDLPMRAADIPIYAAARMMAHDGIDLVRRCIVLGADVRHDSNIVYTSRTPLPVYLYVASVENWNKDQLLRPTEGIKFWLGQGMAIDDGRVGKGCPQPGIWSSGSLPSMIEMLIDKWGADFLANDEFNRVISLLAKPGLSDQHLSLLDRLPSPKDPKNGVFEVRLE